METAICSVVKVAFTPSLLSRYSPRVIERRVLQQLKIFGDCEFLEFNSHFLEMNGLISLHEDYTYLVGTRQKVGIYNCEDPVLLQFETDTRQIYRLFVPKPIADSTPTERVHAMIRDALQEHIRFLKIVFHGSRAADVYAVPPFPQTFPSRGALHFDPQILVSVDGVNKYKLYGTTSLEQWAPQVDPESRPSAAMYQPRPYQPMQPTSPSQPRHPYAIPAPMGAQLPPHKQYPPVPQVPYSVMYHPTRQVMYHVPVMRQMFPKPPVKQLLHLPSYYVELLHRLALTRHQAFTSLELLLNRAGARLAELDTAGAQVSLSTAGTVEAVLPFYVPGGHEQAIRHLIAQHLSAWPSNSVTVLDTEEMKEKGLTMPVFVQTHLSPLFDLMAQHGKWKFFRECAYHLSNVTPGVWDLKFCAVTKDALSECKKRSIFELRKNLVSHVCVSHGKRQYLRYKAKDAITAVTQHYCVDVVWFGERKVDTESTTVEDAVILVKGLRSSAAARALRVFIDTCVQEVAIRCEEPIPDSTFKTWQKRNTYVFSQWNRVEVAVNLAGTAEEVECGKVALQHFLRTGDCGCRRAKINGMTLACARLILLRPGLATSSRTTAFFTRTDHRSLATKCGLIYTALDSVVQEGSDDLQVESALKKANVLTPAGLPTFIVDDLRPGQTARDLFKLLPSDPRVQTQDLSQLGWTFCMVGLGEDVLCCAHSMMENLCAWAAFPPAFSRRTDAVRDWFSKNSGAVQSSVAVATHSEAPLPPPERLQLTTSKAASPLSNVTALKTIIESLVVQLEFKEALPFPSDYSVRSWGLSPPHLQALRSNGFLPPAEEVKVGEFGAPKAPRLVGWMSTYLEETDSIHDVLLFLGSQNLLSSGADLLIVSAYETNDATPLQEAVMGFCGVSQPRVSCGESVLMKGASATPSVLWYNPSHIADESKAVAPNMAREWEKLFCRVFEQLAPEHEYIALPLLCGDDDRTRDCQRELALELFHGLSAAVRAGKGRIPHAINVCFFNQEGLQLDTFVHELRQVSWIHPNARADQIPREDPPDVVLLYGNKDGMPKLQRKPSKPEQAVEVKFVPEKSVQNDSPSENSSIIA